MAQSSITVTPPSPTPPTNMAFVGVTGPNPPNYRRNTYDNPFNLDANRQPVVSPVSVTGVNPNPPPWFDDAAGGVAGVGPGTGAVLPAFKTNAAALTAGVSSADTGTGITVSTVATGAGGTGVNSERATYPGTLTPLPPTLNAAPPNQLGLVPASTSVAAEGAGTEVVLQKVYGSAATDYNPNTFLPYSGTGGGIAGAVTGTWQMVVASTGPSGFTGVANSPNGAHASSLSPLTNPTLTSITPTTAVSGTGTVALTAVTGVGFTPQSVVYANGVAIPTVYVSSTTLTATMPKKATSGPWPITVVTGGVVTTLPQTFSWT
jgi:hypothetical protein